VDDEVFNLASIKLMLGTLGYEVDIVKIYLTFEVGRLLMGTKPSIN
jgi:hypothetical protein